MDVDECTATLPCSQRCINTFGSYKCLCVDGYEALERDPNTCKALSGQPDARVHPQIHDFRVHLQPLKLFLTSAEEPFLIMADHHEIRKLSVDGSNYTILKQVRVIYYKDIDLFKSLKALRPL